MTVAGGPNSNNPLRGAEFRPDFRADRYTQPPEKRNWGFVIAAAISAGVGALIFAGYYFYTISDMFDPNKSYYQSMGISLPRSFESYGQSSRYLAQLRREPCDSIAFDGLVKAMEAAGYPRESALAAEAYHHGCAASETMLQLALSAYNRIGDHKEAIRVADLLVQTDAGSPHYRFWRGNAYELSKEYKLALADYKSTLELFTDLSNVAGSQFYQVSLMYDKLGKPCDAIAPLETFISYNVKERQTQQIARLISDYSQRGKCAATYATGSARVVIPPSNVVEVIINGVRATMIIDSGASTVSMTPEMAARARITPDATDLVDVKTVGGRMKQASGYAQTIRVGDATAANVPLLIAIGSTDTFGPGIDGLLGMTYLSRFDMKLSPGLFELKPRTRI